MDRRLVIEVLLTYLCSYLPGPLLSAAWGYDCHCTDVDQNLFPVA
jgi:hypothetical protein